LFRITNTTIVGRSVADDGNHPPLFLGQLDSDGGGQAEAQAARGGEVIAAGTAHLDPVPEDFHRRRRLVHIDGVVGGGRVDDIEERVGADPAAFLPGQ
jgi:hypothetical protein